MHDGHRERMRKRYQQNGIDGFAPHEVLEMLLYYTKPRVDTNETAHLLLETFGSLSGVFDADINLLCQVPGVGMSTAIFFHLIRDAMTLYTKYKWTDHPQLTTSDKAGEYAADMIGTPSEECFYLISLNATHHVLAFSKISSGTAYKTDVDIRMVVECALRHRAHTVILVHNHPSGALSPSEQDILLTKRLVQTFREIEIPVIDHIIVGNGTYYSMAIHHLI